MAVEVRVPRDTVNDDTVRIVRWLVGDGAELRQGMPLVELETSKSVVEVEAAGTGRLRILRPAGDHVPIGEVLGWIGDAEPAAATPAAVAPPAVTDATGGQTRPRNTFSASARRLLAEHGIDEAVFDHLPLVREADVLAHLAQAAPEEARSPSSSAASREGTGGTERTRDDWKPRGLWGDASRASTDRGVSLAWLALNYLWRNWFLGNLTKVAPRGVINVLHRWRGVRMGTDCFIDPAAILETAYPENITLGDDVRVTAGAIIMTHIKPPHYLRDKGYVPVVLKPVVLEDHCFIGVNAVVMPGVTVGRASVVASGAVVTANVPPLTMVAGNPAKVVRRFDG